MKKIVILINGNHIVTIVKPDVADKIIIDLKSGIGPVVEFTSDIGTNVSLNRLRIDGFYISDYIPAPLPPKDEVREKLALALGKIIKDIDEGDGWKE